MLLVLLPCGYLGWNLAERGVPRTEAPATRFVVPDPPVDALEASFPLRGLPATTSSPATCVPLTSFELTLDSSTEERD